MGVGESSSSSPPPFVIKSLPYSSKPVSPLFDSSFFPPFAVNNSKPNVKVIPQLDGNDSQILSDYGSVTTHEDDEQDDNSINDENCEEVDSAPELEVFEVS